MSMSSRCLRALLLILPLLAAACGDDADGQLTSTQAPIVREVEPSAGPVAGHTLINVYGSGFREGARLYLGDQEALRVVVVNNHRIYGYTPTALAGVVDVRVVNPDSAYAVLVGGYTFEGAPVARIVQAEVLNGNVDAVSNGQPVAVTLRGAVTVAGITRGTGQGGGVRAQLGFAPADAALLAPDSYTWTEAAYEGDSNNREADIYQGTVLLQPAIHGERREWVVTMRFSIDAGASWVMADGDGSANGVAEDMLRRVFISRPRVDYCKLGPDGNRGPLDIFYRPGDTTLTKVAGQVYAAGVTPGSGAGSGVSAQLGYGPADSDPRNSNAWTWLDATYKTDHGNNDEWEAAMPNPGTLGTWRVAFRFSISENVWRYCDTDGVNDSTEGELTFSLARLGTLTVGNEAPKPPITWCKLGLDQTPPEVINYTTTQTSGLRTVYAQVHLPGVTDRQGAGPGIAGQLGWGPVGEDPRTSPLWNWTTQLTFDKDNFGANDQWKGTLPNPVANGEYRYAVRFNHDGGPLRVCDGNGVDDAGQDFELDQLGVLTVTGQPVVPRDIGYCKLGPNENHSPQTLAYTTAEAPSHVITAYVHVAGLTNTTEGESAGIVGQLGWGPEGESPATSAAWDWTTTAQFREDFHANDRYEATLPNPGVVGAYRFAYRFQVNGGEFLYCDADGNSTGPDGFDVALTGTLAVSAQDPNPEPTDAYCRLQSVSGTAVSSGDTITVVGRVHIPGITSGEGPGANVQVQVGIGAADVNASAQAAAFTWKAAQYASEADGEADTDEFSTTLTPAYTGDRAVSMRYSTDGTTWTYCDKDGSNVGGYTRGQQHALTVGDHTEIDYCNLQHPLTVSRGAGAQAIYGKIYEDGVTNAPPPAAGLTAELGFGPKEQDPGVGEGWGWQMGTVNGDGGDDDEYSALIPEHVPVGHSYLWRYRVGTGPYCFGDWQPDGEPGGSTNGVSPETLGTVVP